MCLHCTATWLCVLAKRSTPDTPVIAATQVLARAVARRILSCRQSNMAGLQHHRRVSEAGESNWGSTGMCDYFNSCASAVLQICIILCLFCIFLSNLTSSARFKLICAGPSGRAVSGVGLRPLAYRDRGFESHRGHGCLSVVSVVCCQVEVSAKSWSLVQRSPTDCGASSCVI